MRFSPTIAEVKRSKDSVEVCFVACDIHGAFTAFAVINKSRYEMGTARPLQVSSWLVEFLAREEVASQDFSFGNVVRIHDTDFLVVGVDGDEIVLSLADCMAHFKQLNSVKRLYETQKRSQEAEKNGQHEQKKKLAEVEKRRSEERIDYVGRLEDRKRRMQRYFKLMRLFPELEIYRAAVEQEHQVQIDLEKQSLDNLHMLMVDLQKANKSETLNLISLRYKADKLWQEYQRQLEQVRLAQQKRQKEENKRQAQEDQMQQEQARLQAEQEKKADKEKLAERHRLEQWRLAQEAQKRQLKLQHQRRQNYQQELLQAQYAILPTSEELTRRLRGLVTFYPPSRDNYDAYVQQLKLLSIGCKRCLNSVSKPNDTEKWRNALIEIKRLKTQCLKLAEGENWLCPEEDEAWKDL